MNQTTPTQIYVPQCFSGDGFFLPELKIELLSETLSRLLRLVQTLFFTIQFEK